MPGGVAGAAALLGWAGGAGMLWALVAVSTRARLAWFVQQPWYGRNELHLAFLEEQGERGPCVSEDVALLLDEEIVDATPWKRCARPAWSIRAARLTFAQSFNEA